MRERKQQHRWRWPSLAIVFTLLTLSLIVVSSHVAAAQEPLSPAGLEVDQYDLQVATWDMLMPTPAQPGGVAVYGIWYGNLDAPRTAEGVTISDFLPPGTTYVGDTSGLPHSVNAGVITWDVGTLAPGDTDLFVVTLGIPPETIAPGVIDPNQVAIAPILDDLNVGNNEASSEPVEVIPPVPIDVEVGKYPEPGDPTPGEEFQYVLTWCNNSDADVGPVTLIDTLPDGTHYVDWRVTQWWQRFWNLVSASDDAVEIEAPGVPARTCQDIILVLQVDETIGISTTLTNTVEIQTAGDVEPGNDLQINSDAHVSPPRADMMVGKSFNGGVLVPGGWIEYGGRYWNQGNVPVNATLVDTLPPNLIYRAGSTQMNGESYPDPTIGGQELVWELGPVAVNQGADFSFIVDIDPGAPYEEFGNCVTISHDQEDDTPWDNETCVGVEIWPPGANLHVEKWSQYNYDHINYYFFAANVGDVLVPGVVIRDTYPAGTEAGGEPSVPDHLQPKTLVSSAPGEWIIEITELEPGESGWFDFTVGIVNPEAKPAEFLNVITIDSPEFDVNPADNYDEDRIVIPEIDRVELFLEPDGQSSMWGEAVAGQVVTVTTESDVYTTTAGMDECPTCWEIQDTGIVIEGEEITVEAAEGTMPVVFTVPDPFTAVLDRAAGTVSGQIDHLDTEPVEVRGWWWFLSYGLPRLG